MVTTKEYGGITWIDLYSPSEEEIASVKKQFKIHELTAHELLEPSERAKVDPYKDYLYTILHFPNIHHETHQKDNREIDFILGKKFLITCHYQDTPVLESFREDKLPEEILGEHKTLPHAGFLFFHLMRHLYNSYEGHLEAISDDLVDIEESIFGGHEREMVELLGIVSHDIMDIKRSLKAHASILVSLELAGKHFFGDDFEYYLRAITGDYQKAWNLTLDTKETLLELRETNDSLLSTKTNEIMKVLTIMAFLTFPLTLIAGIFGMNSNLPIVGHPGDFWIIIAIMLVASLLMVGYFRYKKWL